MRISLVSWRDQAQRIALFRTNRLPILSIGKETNFHCLIDWDASRHDRSIAALYEQPFGAGFDTHFVQDCRQRDPCPFGSRDETVRALYGFQRGLRPLREAIARTFNEKNSGYRREALHVQHREFLWLFHHPMHEQLMRGRINCGDAAMSTCEMQS